MAVIVLVDFACCFALGDYLYAGNQADNTLKIYNIANPASPASVGSCALIAAPAAIWLSNSVCYIADVAGNIYAINIDNPAAPFVEPNGIAQSGEAWSHLRAVGDIGILSGPSASFVALYDLGIRPPREIQNSDTLVGSQAAIQGRRLFFGDTAGSPRAVLRNFRIGGQFCALMHTYDLYAETQVTTELVRARHGYFGGELVCDQLTVAGGAADTDTGSGNFANYISLGSKRLLWSDSVADPNGLFTAPFSSMFLASDGTVWRNADAGTTWTAM